MLSINSSAPKRNICAGNGSAESSSKCSDAVRIFSSTVSEIEATGAAGVFFEDQTWPKKMRAHDGPKPHFSRRDGDESTRRGGCPGE